MIANLLGLSTQTEILIIISLGVFVLSQDFSLFHLKSDVEKVWKLELLQSHSIELITKYVLTAVVLVRTLTLHLFIACYIIMLWPAVFEEKPNLCLPWLFIGIIRSLMVNFITFVLGSYICQKEAGLKPICLDFVLSYFIEHGPAVYAWFVVLSFYRELVSYENPNFSDLNLLSNPKMTEPVFRDKSKSLSLSACHLYPWKADIMKNKKDLKKMLNGDINFFDIGLFTKELRNLSSRSSDSLINLLRSNQHLPLDIFDSVLNVDCTLKDKVVYVLGLTKKDIELAKQDKNKMVKALEDVKTEDSLLVDVGPRPFLTSKSFYAKKGKILKGSASKLHHLKSVSLYSDANSEHSYNSCLCFLKKQLQRESSNQTLLEQEIYNIEFDGSRGSSRKQSNEDLNSPQNKEKDPKN